MHGSAGLIVSQLVIKYTPLPYFINILFPCFFFVSMLAAQAISHPFVVFGRQCQVNNNANRFHLSPFTVFQFMTRLERKQV